MTEPLTSAHERRQSQRTPMDAAVWLEKTPRFGQSPSLVRARTRDVSNRGLFVWSPLVFQLGEQLQLEMNVTPNPNQHLDLNIKGTAEVVRLEGRESPNGRPGVALKILEFKPVIPLPSYDA